jgi:hypothetical protein
MEPEFGSYSCSYCGHPNETTLDPSGGLRQEYVEDCAVCCRPNVLKVTFDPEQQSVSVESAPES